MGNVFTNSFDGLNRLKISAGPPVVTVTGGGITPGGGTLTTNITQQFTGYVYDASGQVMTVTNALGEKTVTTSDALGRPTQVAFYPSNSMTPARLTTTFYSPDHQSVTITNGTGTNAIVKTAYTDNDGHKVLTLSFPTSGVTEYVWQKYDRLGRQIAQQQLSSSAGVITTWATNGATYDGLNRVLTQTSKDAALTTLAYDPLGDVTNRAMPGGLTWSAGYLNDGRIASEQVNGGSLTARSMAYQYYGAGSTFAGKLQIVTDGRSTTRSNSYDDFLRLATVVTSGSAPEQQTSSTFQYDLRHALTNVVQSFNSTNTGPSTQISRSFDSYGRIGAENTYVGGLGLSGIQQGWDTAGRRSALGFSTGMNIGFAYQADGMMTQAGEATFGYANNGLLVSRANSSRTYTINQRDGMGRIVQATTKVGSTTVLAEGLSWRNDDRLNSYTATRSDFTDARNYAYSPLAQRLTQESLNTAAGQTVTNNYTIDNNSSGGLGILTAKSEIGGAAAAWLVPSSGGLDGLSRDPVAKQSN